MNSIKLIFAILIALFFMPLIGKTQNFFNSNGMEIHFKIIGNGKSVILIHGFYDLLQMDENKLIY